MTWSAHSMRSSVAVLRTRRTILELARLACRRLSSVPNIEVLQGAEVSPDRVQEGLHLRPWVTPPANHKGGEGEGDADYDGPGPAVGPLDLLGVPALDPGPATVGVGEGAPEPSLGDATCLSHVSHARKPGLGRLG